MEDMKGYSLEDFLELALRHGVIDGFKVRGADVRLVVEGESHRLDASQTWSYLSGIMYDRYREAALGHHSLLVEKGPAT